jgi:RHS repeat-associated protein
MVHAARGGGGDVYFAYDAGGERVRKVLVDGSTIKERVYLGAYEVYRERSATGTIALERRTLHVHDDKRRVALVELRTKGNDGSPARLVRYQLDNHLGSAVVELDQAAALLSYEEYHPFGTTAYRATASVLDKNPKRYAFIGKERDEETGLYYCGLRYLAAWLGRWASVDPKGFVDGPNPYVYARNRPTSFTDPSGGQSQEGSPQTTHLQFEDEVVIGERHSKAFLAGQAFSFMGAYQRKGDTASAAEWSAEHQKLWEESRHENAMKWLKTAGAAHLIAATTALAAHFGGGVALAAGAGPLTTAAIGGGSGGLGSELALRLLGKPYSGTDYLKAIGEGTITGMVLHGVGRLFGPKPLSTPKTPGGQPPTDVPVASSEEAAPKPGTMSKGDRLADVLKRPFEIDSPHGRDMFKVARQALADASELTPKEKADVFEEIATRINERDPSWQANRGPATNAVGFFTGEGRPFGFAVDEQGRVWQTLDIGQSMTYSSRGATINYGKWDLIRPR